MPLNWASDYGHVDVVKLLLDRGADINTKDKEAGSTPLHGASSLGYVDVIKLLLEKGADINAKDTRIRYTTAFCKRGRPC